MPKQVSPRVPYNTDDQYLLPSISRQDYEAFSRLNDSDLPETYDQWLKFMQRRRIGVGGPVSSSKNARSILVSSFAIAAHEV